MRRKPIFETLESRLLLSADLAPVEGVLEVIGTNESDLAFITARAERLLVELNGQAYEFALEGIKEIRVDLGEGDNRFEADLLNPVGTLSVVAGSGNDAMVTHARWDGASVDDHPDFLWLPTFNPGSGNDEVALNLSQLAAGATRAPVIQVSVDTGAGNDLLQGRVLLDADWNIQLGDGDDIADIETLIGDVFADAHYRVDAGEGDNETTLRFGDGEHGARPPSGAANVTAEYRSGGGNDTVQLDWRVHPDRMLGADLDLLTGAGNDFIEAVMTTPGPPGMPAAPIDLFIDAGDGNDVVVHEVTHVVQQGGTREPAGLELATGIDLGTGADSLRFAWRGPLQDRASDIRFDLQVDAGGADAALPEVGDEVLVTFMNGDPDRPFVLGTVWNSQDAPGDAKRLETSLLSAGGSLAITSAINGGAARDEVRLSVDGLVGPKTQVNAEVDLGAGADAMTIDFTGLEAKGPIWRAPIRLDLRGGAGEDTLAVTGTRGNDWILLAPRAMLFAGDAHINFAGFQSVHVDAADGNDRVWLLGRSPRIDWLVDGGDGRDRFFAPFGPGDNVALLDFENPKLKKKR